MVHVCTTKCYKVQTNARITVDLCCISFCLYSNTGLDKKFQ